MVYAIGDPVEHFTRPYAAFIVKLIAPALATTLAFSATTAFAGGPVIVEDEVEVVAEKPASSVGILPLLLIPIILCIALCGGDDEDEQDIIIIGPVDG